MKKLSLSLGFLLTMYIQSVSACPPIYFDYASPPKETRNIQKPTDVNSNKQENKFLKVNTTEIAYSDCSSQEIPMPIQKWTVTVRGNTYNLFLIGFLTALFISVLALFTIIFYIIYRKYKK